MERLSPLDGRYFKATEALQTTGSEEALFRYRVKVEVMWLLALASCTDISEIKQPSDSEATWLLDLVNRVDCGEIKSIERKTNHDVKAVEYWIKEQLLSHDFWKQYGEFTHFGCTSEDINNLAYALMAKELREKLLQSLKGISSTLCNLSQKTADMAMLSLTHGQPASPTTLGKELINVDARLNRQIYGFAKQPILGKCNGAVGNFNAHLAAYPDVNWLQLSTDFIHRLGLEENWLTTQIEPHDFLAEWCHWLVRINTILIDLSRDIWGYISRGYFGQILREGEVGSSTMPHKVNPIDFENAEGNLGVAISMLEHLATKLPVSRFQRDLSDSTVLRNLGSVAGYCYLAYSSLQKGLHKVEPRPEVMLEDLNNNPEVLAEAIQTVMRRYGIDRPYERLKELTRGQNLTLKNIQEFIRQLPLPEDAKSQIIDLTPDGYTGMAEELVKQYLRKF